MARGIAWLWLTLCLSTVAGAEENAVERAAALAEDLRFSEAARVLEGARAQPGLDRPTLLRILELQGVVAASIGRVDAARTAFRTLVVLEPGYALKGNYSPKVMAPAPTGDAALRLWDAIQVLSEEPGFFEITRPRRNRPQVTFT